MDAPNNSDTKPEPREPFYWARIIIIIILLCDKTKKGLIKIKTYIEFMIVQRTGFYLSRIIEKCRP